MTNKTLLTNEIASQMEELKHLEVGSAQYETAVNGISKLFDKALEIDKLEAETRYKYDVLDEETDMKRKQLEADKHDRKIKNLLTGLGIGIPAGISVWGTLKSIEFEKFGSITTLAGKTHLNKVLNLFKK